MISGPESSYVWSDDSRRLLRVLTHVAHSDIPRLRCRLWHLSARIFREQGPQWRWHIRCRQRFLSEYQYHSPIRVCSRRRFGSVLDLLHPCPCIHQAVHLDYWYIEHPFRHWHCGVLLCETLLLCCRGFRCLWYLQHCTYMLNSIVPTPDF